MFRCNDCGHVFEVPITQREDVANLHIPSYEYVDVCPECRSKDITEYMEEENK